MTALRNEIIKILRHGPMTQAQLASFFGIRKKYVQRLTAELRLDHIIRYGGVVRRGTGKGGRPQQYFEIVK
jgi:predicted ArsR family transcriptional regulator